MNRTIFSLFALLTAFPVLISAVSDKSLFTLIFEGIQSHVTKNYEDRTKTEAAPAATLMSDCDCTEYLYLNDIALGEVHKFAVDPTTGDITEIGSPWMGGFDSPHGLGVDLNGFLYIGNHPSDGPIRKVTCDGNIIDADWNTTITGGGLTNIGSVGNFILANGAFESSEFSNIQVLDACSGDRLGSICLEGSNFGDWGMQVLNDGTVLVTEGIDIQLGFGAPATKTIWKFPFDENLIGNADPNCVTPFVQGGYLNDYEEIYGITSDDTHLYMVARKNGGNTFLVKVDATTGAFVAEINESTMSGTDGSNPGYNGARGIIYAPSSDKLYVSGIEDCISIVNPADLSYEGAGAGIVTNGEPKAIGILKECCPNVTPLAFNETICSDGNGERLFLQDFLNCGDGVICEGQWSVQTPNANQVFESCDLSITVNGSGCGTYVLEKTTGAAGNQQCGAFQIEVQICTEVPGADNITPAQGTCTGTTPNDDATVNLTGVTGDEANITPGATYSGPAYGDASNTNVSGGSGQFTGLVHATQYTVRVWNGSDGCFTDETFTTPDVPTCVQPLSLGNRVFLDGNNDGVQNGAESGIDGVTLQLLTASGAIYDSDPDTPGVQGLTVTTANGGYYRFDNLLPGSYIVEVLPSNFGGALENYGSSTGAGQEADPDSNGDTNDNGLDTPTSAGAIRSGVVTLSDSEPTGEAEPGAYGAGSTTGTAAADDLSNLTVDFGFQRLRDNPDYEDPQNPCPQEPCHFISNSVYLGSGVSSDNDTNNTSTADTDTDDGVALGSNLNFAPGGTINFPVTIFNSSGNDVFLFAWVDWNGDGDFDDTGEQISNNSYNGTTFSGTFMVNLPAAVPTDALQNEAFAARFRVSTDNTNANSPCGSGDCAADGEIEDYLLLIECPTSVCTPAEVIIIRN